MNKNKLISMIMGLGTALAVQAQVVQDSLPALSTETVGVETAFSANLWGQKVDADDVIRQIKACADVPFNTHEREILRQVLMTDVGGVTVLDEKGAVYLKARLNTLLRQGMFEETLTLLDKVADNKQTDELKQLRAEALFGLGRMTEACADYLTASFGTDEAFIRAVCAEETTEPPASALAYEVYRERGFDSHPFLNAVGERLYRDLPAKMPNGVPSVWEVPMLAKVFGMDVFQLSLDREKLVALLNHEQVPDEIKQQAQNILDGRIPKVVQPNGQVLSALIRLAEARRELESNLPQKLK